MNYIQVFCICKYVGGMLASCNVTILLCMFFEYHLLLQHSIEVFIFFITFFAERRILRKIRRNSFNQKLNFENMVWNLISKRITGTILMANLVISQLIIH